MPPSYRKTLVAIHARLREPLPKESLSEIKDWPGHFAVNPMYVRDRLDEVLGLGNWSEKYRVIETGVNVVVQCTLTLRIGKAVLVRTAFGGNSASDRGDAFKGAQTDSFTKAASLIGVGGAVYKGLQSAEKFREATNGVNPSREQTKTSAGQSTVGVAPVVKEQPAQGGRDTGDAISRDVLPDNILVRVTAVHGGYSGYTGSITLDAVDLSRSARPILVLDCRHGHLFDVIRSSPNQVCAFRVSREGRVINIEDVLKVGPAKYRNGVPGKQDVPPFKKPANGDAVPCAEGASGG